MMSEVESTHVTVGGEFTNVHQVHDWSAGSAKKLFIMCALLTLKATFWMQE